MGFLLKGITTTTPLQPNFGTSNSSDKNSKRGFNCEKMNVNICLRAGAKSLSLFGGLRFLVGIHEMPIGLNVRHWGRQAMTVRKLNARLAAETDQHTASLYH